MFRPFKASVIGIGVAVLGMEAYTQVEDFIGNATEGASIYEITPPPASAAVCGEGQDLYVAYNPGLQDEFLRSASHEECAKHPYFQDLLLRDIEPERITPIEIGYRI